MLGTGAPGPRQGLEGREPGLFPEEALESRVANVPIRRWLSWTESGAVMEVVRGERGLGRSTEGSPSECSSLVTGGQVVRRTGGGKGLWGP